ncbi:MAG: IPT/TIG domain-containing protein, partial [Bdellovibrionota bacterium]
MAFFGRIIPLSLAIGCSALTGCGNLDISKLRNLVAGSPPTITSITPSTGVLSGRTSVTILGTNFTSSTSVTIGGKACTSVTFVSGTKLTCITSAHPVGAGDIVVVGNGGSATLKSGFTYIDLMYVATTTGNALQAYQIDPASGALTQVGGDVPIPGLPGATIQRVQLSPTNSSLYLLTYSTSYFYGINVDASTGAMSGALASNTLADAGCISMALDPGGSYVWIGSFGGPTLYGYNLDPVTHLVSNRTTLVGGGGGGYTDMVLDSTGTYLYAAAAGAGALAGFTISNFTASTTTPSSFATMLASYPVAQFDRTGTYVFMGSGATLGTDVWGFSVTPGTGVLVNTAPTHIYTTGTNPGYIVFSPDNKYVYVGNTGDDTIAQYSFNTANGNWTALAPATVSIGFGCAPGRMEFDSQAKYLYVNCGNGVAGIPYFSVDSGTGKLSAAPVGTLSTI